MEEELMESDSVETSSPGPFLGGSAAAWATVSAALVSRLWSSCHYLRVISVLHAT